VRVLATLRPFLREGLALAKPARHSRAGQRLDPPLWHTIISIALHPVSALLHQLIERMQIQIGRTEGVALFSSGLGSTSKGRSRRARHAALTPRDGEMSAPDREVTISTF
jgi:hypothetical protein